METIAPELLALLRKAEAAQAIANGTLRFLHAAIAEQYALGEQDEVDCTTGIITRTAPPSRCI